MLTGTVKLLRLAELERAVMGRIRERTAGQILSLKVEVLENQVVITGCAASYYQKQLALQGALEVTAATGGAQIDCQIEVVHPPSRTGARARCAPSIRRRR
jgi:hypothetical protein